VQFSATLPGGLFGFNFYYSSYGFATCSANVTIAIAKPTFSNIVASYNGGVFTLSGSGLSPSATLDINGFKGSLSSITATNAIGSIPAFVSTLSQNYYSLTTPYKLTLSDFTILSDTQQAETYPFDGTQGTVYTSNSASTCYIGIDVGS
jgi:hypothetical protein